MNASRSRREVTSETSIFNALKTKIIPHCHSERSEESLIASVPNVQGIRQRCFAPLNMTDDLRNVLRRTSLHDEESLQRFSHFFLTHDQINEQHIQRDELEPKVINRLPKEEHKE